MVLDDYHTIHDASIHGLLNEFLRHPLQSLHLVMITRVDPDLDLIQLRAQGKMREIRMSNLRFSPSESTEFLELELGRPVGDEFAASILKKTEGWITGLQLTAMALTDESDLYTVPLGLPGEY